MLIRVTTLYLTNANQGTNQPKARFINWMRGATSMSKIKLASNTI